MSKKKQTSISELPLNEVCKYVLRKRGIRTPSQLFNAMSNSPKTYKEFMFLYGESYHQTMAWLFNYFRNSVKKDKERRLCAK